jgi:hypothetical protein
LAKATGEAASGRKMHRDSRAYYTSNTASLPPEMRASGITGINEVLLGFWSCLQTVGVKTARFHSNRVE